MSRATNRLLGLTLDIAEMVAAAADESNVQEQHVCEAWSDLLHEAVEEGLDAARQRAGFFV